MDMHRVRLDLRPRFKLERRLSEHLAAKSGRRHARNIAVREILELGLSAEPVADVPELTPEDLPVDPISVDLVRPGDAAVLDALARIPKKQRADHLRGWLLAGFVAAERLPTSVAISNSPLAVESASPAQASITHPSPPQASTLAQAAAPAK